MKNGFLFFMATCFAIVFTPSCKTSYQTQSVQYKDYRITQSYPQDAKVVSMMQPYSDSVNKSMNNVIAIAESELVKQQPEGTLNNVLADAMLAMARKNYGMNVDAAFINFGGVRLNSVPAGNITRGKVFEIAPFDNILVLQKMDGATLQKFLDNVSARKGWPAAGITWQIRQKKAVNVMIGGKPLDPSAIYTIANNDYVANGGDDMEMLKVIPQINNGYLFRDAVIEYFTQLTAEGKKVSAKIENRISNAE